MYRFNKRRKNLPVKRIGSKGFPEGLNTLAHESALKDTELSELINGIYSQYGTISKRQGTKLLGDASSGGTEITQLGATYKIGDEDRFIRISDSGVPEYWDFATLEWKNLTADAPEGYVGTTPAFTDGVPTFNTTVFTNIVQAQDKIIFANSEDQMVWLDADGWHASTALADPTVKATVAKSAGTGTTNYFYAYVNYTEAGGTLASPEGIVGTDASGTGWIQNMTKVLDSTNYLTITIPAAPAGTTKRAIFRGNAEGALYYLDDMNPSETTYIDKGEINPSERYMTPDENDTAGQHFYLLEAYENNLVGVSKELGRDVVSFSAGFEKLMSFGLSAGGGYVPYKQGDGTYINAIKTFSAANETSLFIFKDKVVGKLKFVAVDNDLEATIQDINVSVGTLSPLSPHVAGNNLRFWSREGASSIGHEANFGTILRYSVLSIKADEIVQTITPANLPDVCGVFFNHLSLFGVSTNVSGGGNNAILAFDERYNAWSLWTGVYPAIFCKMIHPTTKEEKLYYGSSLDANVLEMFVGKTDYATSTGTGNKITLSLTTKQYDGNLPDQYKRYDKATLVFGTLFGNSTTVGVIRADHNGIHVDPRLRISSDPTLSGFGGDEWGNQEFGMMTEDDSGSTVNIRYLNLKQKDMFWVKINIQNDGIEDELSIIGIYIYYSDSNKPLPFATKLKTIA
jgi:hypothetical protein